MTKRTPPFSPEVRERAVRMVEDHQGEHSSRHAAMRSMAAKIGCSGETLRHWIKEAESSKGLKPGATTDEREGSGLRPVLVGLVLVTGLAERDGISLVLARREPYTSMEDVNPDLLATPTQGVAVRPRDFR